MLEIDNEFYQVAAILGVAALIGIVGAGLKQPLIVAYIVVGILVGPSFLGITGANDPLDLLAEVGIALLLFVVGLKLDLHVIRTMGRVAVVTGVGQVAFTSIIGFGLALLLGFDASASAYIAIALTFSSTIIIVKLLSDKREIDSLHGRIAVGMLIVQDILVVLTMIVISAVGSGDDPHPLRLAAEVVGKGVGFLVAVALAMRFIIPHLLPRLARSQELLLLSAIAWAITLAMAGDALGFSKEVGAFLAGVSLASSPFREAISGRLTTLRDFLLLFFFVDLGSGLEFDGVASQIPPAIVFSMFVLIGNPLIVITMMGVMGYRRRTGFLTGLAVAQISEFSLIFAALGVTVGHIQSDTLGLITLVGVITIGLSTYMILYSHALYERVERFIRPFERSVRHPEDDDDRLPDETDVIIFGLGRFGSGIASGLREQGQRVLGVDFDPEVVRTWSRNGWPVVYGEADDPELLLGLPLSRTPTVISAVPALDANLTLLRALQQERFEGRIVVTAMNEPDAEFLEGANAGLVLRPFAYAAVRAVEELQ